MDWFARQILNWYDSHGRKDLPWQRNRDPYAIWLSEIMLQQTQVTTVIPYFEKFLARFPDVACLAAAPLDDVLHHWTGLGYYARARNLHRAAQQIVAVHGGGLPDSVDALARLPGIGRSTAGAIAASAFGRRTAILDGNVKRVLARFHTVAGWPGQTAVATHLWALSEAHLPDRRIQDYTQAIMDLGALVCRRARPRCEACPLQSRCEARRLASFSDFPGRKPARALPVRPLTFFILLNDAGEVLGTRRPPQGIWGGLWSFPQADGHVADLPDDLLARHGRCSALAPWPVERHTLTHFHMDILPLRGDLRTPASTVMAPGDWLWYSLAAPARIGLATPVRRILTRIRQADPSSTLEQEFSP